MIVQSSNTIQTTVNFLNIRTPKTFVVITLKLELCQWLYHRVMSPNDADGMANSVDPDQTAQAYLSENLGSLRYNSNEQKEPL